ncbi:MAG: polyprenyl synthetase family protein [Pseudomonadota bacterium]
MTTFRTHLARTAENVESRLDAQLATSAAVAAPRLRDAMRYAVLNGGKRFRPFLVLEAAALFDVADSDALETATAIEFIHCYSLVHDDLPAMDDDDLRRGQPTVHKAFDEATAILAGDALQTMAFEVLTGTEAPSEPAIRCELVRILAGASGLHGMCGGQMLDLEAESAPADAADVATIQSLKTGALIRAAVELGAVLGHASPDERAALVSYATNLGLAFQISDDLLDVTGDAATVGKATGKDAAAGKGTFISQLGVAGARKRLAETEAAAIAALSVFGDRADMLAAAARFMAAREK